MRGFKLAALNIRNLTKHIDKLGVMLSDNPIDVLALNETWLDQSIHDSNLYNNYFWQ